MKNILILNSAIAIFIFNVILDSSLKAQDTLNFYSDTSVICNNIAEPDISCVFKPGPGTEGYEWTLSGYSPGIDWGTPLTEPTIGTWWITPINYSSVHWIWPRNSDGFNCEHAFIRQEIYIPDINTVESSTIEITGDNEYIVYFNGIEIGSDGDCQEPYEGDIWMTSEVYDIDPDLFHLNEEENVLAVHAYNNYLIAGVRFHLQIELSRRPVGINDKEPITKSDSINFYPNPFTDELTITWNLPGSAFAKIEIYNSTGKSIKELVGGIISEGQHEFHWKTNNLPPGIFFIRMKVNNETLIQKIIKL
ncbi:MAG: T9SS type A sorting domain-containing protein [Bacteroidales bacterium]|nr:T9SS type A sorting domain-containing protein [Bacteroidales bacterium]